MYGLFATQRSHNLECLSSESAPGHLWLYDTVGVWLVSLSCLGIVDWGGALARNPVSYGNSAIYFSIDNNSTMFCW